MNKRTKKPKQENAKKFFVISIIFLLTLVGGYLRTRGIFEGSFSFTYDIGRDLLVVSEMVSTLKPTLIGPTTGLEGVFYGPWWYYFLLVPLLLLGGDPLLITLFIAIIGTSNILLGFWLGKKIGGNFIGISLTALIASSQYLIGLSTQIWNPNLVPTFIFLLLLIHLNIISQKKSRILLFLIAGLLIGLTIEMEIIFGILFFFSLFTFSLVFLRKKLSRKSIIYFFIGIGIIEIPRFLFEVRHSFLMSKSILGVSTQPSSFSLDSVLRRENFTELKYVFENLFSTTLSGNNTILGYLLVGLSIFVFIFYYKKASIIEKRLGVFIGMTCIIFYFAFALYPQGLWNHYLVGLPVLFVAFVSIAVSIFKKNFPIKHIVYIFPFIFFWINVNPITQYLENKRPLWEGSSSVYRNQLRVVDYVYKNAEGKDFKYVVYTPPLHDYTYRYLFPWFGKKYYNKVPSQIARLAYFIIEPDDAYKYRRIEWIENRKSDGTIIKEEYLPGFILVQTRITK